MGFDNTEAQERGGRGGSSVKRKMQHPFAMLEHRIIDSAAFADLKPSACRLLILLARQFNGKNNGQLQATFSWCKERGIGSEHTLRDAVADLIAHGFLYRTRSHGANRAWARYALTWLPIKNTDSLFLAGFVPNAWRNWSPEQKKTTPQKLQEQSGRKCSFTTTLPAESAGTTPAKTAAYEESTNYCTASGANNSVERRTNRERKPLTSSNAIRLKSDLDRPLLRLIA